MTKRYANWFTSGGLLSGLGASACCTLPLVLGAVGFTSGAFSSYLGPFRPYFIGFGVITLGISNYLAWKPRGRTGKTAIDASLKEEGDAGFTGVAAAATEKNDEKKKGYTPSSSLTYRLTIAVVTVLSVLLMALPYVRSMPTLQAPVARDSSGFAESAGGIGTTGNQTAPVQVGGKRVTVSSASQDGEEVTFAVAGMSCQNCATGIESSLEAIDGVLSAVVIFTGFGKDGPAIIRYDPSVVTADELREVIEKLGYSVVDDTEMKE